CDAYVLGYIAYFFFFQAEDGIRDFHVTGVQTCALPIWAPDKEGSWLRVLLAENWERAGRFRRALSVLVNGRNLFVQFGEPISLRSAMADGADASRAVRRLTRTLRTAVARQRAAAIGPDPSHR